MSDDPRAAALAAEREGRVQDAFAIVDRAIVQAPNRADLHALRARMIVTAGGDRKEAASHAIRAAELEPGNTSYRDMARDYARAAGLPPPSTAAAPAAATPNAAVSAPASAPAKSKMRPGFTPKTPAEWALSAAGAITLVAIAGWNLWYWILGPMSLGPTRLDAGAVSSIVPLTSLQRFQATDYGVVAPGWDALPDRETKVAALAKKLAEGGHPHDLVLADAGNRIVARVEGGTVTVYAATAAPASH